jgi:AbrB family looped-hinge helix DNA binding protein
MRVTSKGQVTIPLPMRERFGLMPETEVEFVERDGELVVRKVEAAKDSPGARLVARMRGRGSVQMTTDEILALTRGD